MAEFTHIPGGGYTAVKRPDGCWDIKNVPIFATHQRDIGATKDKKTGETVRRYIRVGKDWLHKAILNAHRAYKEDQYLPPLHIRHHADDDGHAPERAGFFLPQKIAQSKIEGEDVHILLADLVGVPDAVYKKIRANALPYRSAEIFDPEKERVDSLALLDHHVPWFRLPLLNITKEVAASPTGQLTKTRTPQVRAVYSRGRHLGVLCYFAGATGMDMEEKVEKDEQYMDGGEEETVEKAGEESVTYQPDDVMGKVLDLLIAIADKVGVGGDEEEAAPEEEAAEAPAAPAEGEYMEDAPKQSDERPAEQEASDDHMGYAATAGRLRAIEGRLNGMYAQMDLGQTIDKVTKDLARFDTSGDLREELTEIGKKDGKKGILAYAAAVKRHSAVAPGKWTGDVASNAGGGNSTALAYKAQGEEAFAKATEFSVMYDELASHNALTPGITREQFIKDNMEGGKITVK